MVIVRTLLTVATSQNWDIYQSDIHNALLHSDLLRRSIWNYPRGFLRDRQARCVNWRSSCMDLNWLLVIGLLSYLKPLTKMVFSRPILTIIYSLITLLLFLCVLVYVDNLIITGNDPAAILSFKKHLNSYFHMNDFGLLKYFSGIEVARNSKGIYLCQQKYTLDILTYAGLLDANL